MNCEETRQALGVYVLGAIDPADRGAVDRHLAECAPCRDELASLAGLPALLGRVTPGEREQAEELGQHEQDQPEGLGGQHRGRPPADPTLLDRILARAAAERRRYRRRRVTIAAAGVVLLVALASGLGGTLAAGLGGASSDPGTPGSPAVSASPSPAAAAFSATDPQSGVSATVTVHPKQWGASVTTRLEDVPSRTSCRLVVLGSGGARDVAGSWRVNYQGSVSVTGSTAMGMDKITKFKIVTDTGRTLVTVPAR